MDPVVGIMELLMDLSERISVCEDESAARLLAQQMARVERFAIAVTNQAARKAERLQA